MRHSINKIQSLNQTTTTGDSANHMRSLPNPELDKIKSFLEQTIKGE